MVPPLACKVPVILVLDRLDAEETTRVPFVTTSPPDSVVPPTVLKPPEIVVPPLACKVPAILVFARIDTPETTRDPLVTRSDPIIVVFEIVVFPNTLKFPVIVVFVATPPPMSPINVL